MGRLPCFVFSDDANERWHLYDVLHQRWVPEEERNGKMMPLTWLHDTLSCEALYMGWCLLVDNDDNLSLFHPSTGQRRPLPQDSRFMPTLDDFIFRFASPPPDCHVVAIHKSDGFFLACRPGVDARWSRMHRFPVGQDGMAFFDAVLCNDKIYAASKSHVIAIDAASLSSTSAPNVTCFPLDQYMHANSSFHKNYLVESDGQLYMVWRSTLQPHELGVCKWGFSSHVWETATSIGNRLFMIGEQYSGSMPAEPDGSTRSGMVYFLSQEYDICSFNVNCRSLTTHYHCRYFHDYNCFNWLLMEEEPGNHDMQIHKHGRHLPAPCNSVVIRSSNPRVGRRGADVVTWSPKNPWLMFANGFDATFRFIDPSSSNASTVYELHIPELLDKHLCHASDDGWLVVVGGNTMFLFNPFTRDRIDMIPPDDEEDNLAHSKYALSSSPTCEGCLLFSINSCIIFLFRLSSNNHKGYREVQKLFYNNDPFTWPLSNPVYYNGHFYCLDVSGKCGAYDPVTNTWFVIDAHIPLFDPTMAPAENCFLIKSDSGDLISVFMDRNHNLIGVYRLDSGSRHRWREVQDMGDNTLFVGPKCCFMATAAKPEMANMICSSKFVGDRGNQLLWHPVGVDIDTYIGPFTRRDRHMQLWVAPRGVGFGYDRATGKNIVPSPFICPTHD